MPGVTLYEGPSVIVSDEMGRLVFRSRPPRHFELPARTTVVDLLVARIVDVNRARDVGRWPDGEGTLEVEGELGTSILKRPPVAETIVLAAAPSLPGRPPSLTDLGTRTSIGPMLLSEVDAIVAILRAHHGWPRRPTPKHMTELARCQMHDFVSISGIYAPADDGLANFGIAHVAGAVEMLRGLVPGRAYVARGFIRPRHPRAAKTTALVSIDLAAIAPLPTMPRLTTPGPRQAFWGSTRFTSFVEPGPRGQQHADFFSPRRDGVSVVGLVRGSAADCGEVVAEVARWVLAELLCEPAYGPLLPVVDAEPPAPVRPHHAAWVSYLLDRSPLPTEASALVATLVGRLDAVFDGLGAVEPFGHAWGILGCIVGAKLQLVRRGLARVVLIRNGQLFTVAGEQGMHAEIIAAGLAPEPGMLDLPTSAFASPMYRRPHDPPIEVDLVPGDRVLLFADDVFEVCDDAFLSTALLEPGLETLRAALHARASSGWALVVLDCAAV